MGKSQLLLRFFSKVFFTLLIFLVIYRQEYQGGKVEYEKSFISYACLKYGSCLCVLQWRRGRTQGYRGSKGNKIFCYTNSDPTASPTPEPTEDPTKTSEPPEGYDETVEVPKADIFDALIKDGTVTDQSENGLTVTNVNEAVVTKDDSIGKDVIDLYSEDRAFFAVFNFDTEYDKLADGFTLRQVLISTVRMHIRWLVETSRLEDSVLIISLTLQMAMGHLALEYITVLNT